LAAALGRVLALLPRRAGFEMCTSMVGKLTCAIAATSPWQSPYVVRLIGSIRRERLDDVIVPNHYERMVA
jgi:hypothetical protein